MTVRPDATRAAPEVSVSASAIRIVLRSVRGRRSPLVVIDGPSGSGKSTFADALVRAWPGPAPELVRLDDVYPGWEGLDAAGSGLARTLLARRRRGRVGGWRRWDWATSTPAAGVRVLPGRGMVLEGCGSFAAARHDPDAVHVWVEASEPLRKSRALVRDDGRFDDHWEIWDRQWRRHSARLESRRRADVLVRVVGSAVWKAPPGRARRPRLVRTEDYVRNMSADTSRSEYIAEFLDGPLEGDFEHRALVGGKPEQRVGMMAAVDGLESLFWYDAVDEHEVNGQLRVRFRFDAGDSDPVEYDEDNNDSPIS